MTIPALILASTSPYRRAQFQNLGLRFQQRAPTTDETPRSGEPAESMARRLAESKARSVADQMSDGQWIVAGSDQVCHHEGEVMRKPGDFDRASAQLARFSDSWVSFTTGLSLINQSGRVITDSETFNIRFKPLTEQVIRKYLETDQPFDCAGAIKVEQLGVTLLKDTRGRDINSLIGMPLMLLGDLLEHYSLKIMDFK